MQSKLSGLGCLLLIASGCGGTSQGEKVRDARMARVDEHAEARQDAADRREDAREDAIDQRYDNKEAQVEASNRPGEEGSEELVEVSKERAEYQADARARLEKIATRIGAAQKKVQVLGAQAPFKLKTELQTAAKQYDLVKQEVQQLDQTPPDKWEGTTKQLEAHESGLDDRVSEIEDSIDDQ